MTRPRGTRETAGPRLTRDAWLDWRLGLYNLGLVLLSPALGAYLLWRALRARGRGKRWGRSRLSAGEPDGAVPAFRRLYGQGMPCPYPCRWGQSTKGQSLGATVHGGTVPRRTALRGPRIWIHAVSVGEVAAAGRLIEALRRRLPGGVVSLVSTTTAAGRAMAARVCRDADAIFYFPLDIIPAVERALERARPDLVLLVQSELWPNFISAARRRGIPTMVVNGRVSDRAMRRLRLLGPLFRWVVRRVDRFGMQSGLDARRIVGLGADEGRVSDLGNIKFDQVGARVSAQERDRLARELGVAGAQTVIVAASTHPGEEKIALDAFHTVRQVDPGARLIIAPRHIERAREVEQEVAQAGLRARRRSHGPAPSGREGPPSAAARGCTEGPNTVVILDTIGELERVYGIATAAFVGGSFLASVGGHNIVEPAAQGVPSVFGPHMETQRDIAGVITAAQLGFQVRQPQDVGGTLAWLLEDRKRLAAIGRRCEEVLARHRGAADRCAAAAAQLIGGNTGTGGLAAASGSGAPSPEGAKAPRGRRPRAHLSASVWITCPRISPRLPVLAARSDDRRGGPQGLARFPAFPARLLVSLLTPASALYWLGLKVNLLAYRLGLLRVTRLPAQVISVGNLTTGGTGKTSAAALLAASAAKGGRGAAVLSRGYGRRGARGGAPLLVSDGARVLADEVSAGDEPVLLGRKVAGAAVLVGKDRRETGRRAISALGAQVLILDDGFQYWRLAKDREIVLIDGLCPFGNGMLLPAGILREPLSHLRRAHEVWITHADLAGRARVAAIRHRIARVFAGPIVETVHRPVDIVSLDASETVGLGWLAGRPVVALSGIGNPRAFELTLERLGARVAPVRFPDHHPFCADECRAVERLARGRGATIVTTEKDAVRLSAGMFTEAVWVLRVEMAAAEAGTALVT